MKRAEKSEGKTVLETVRASFIFLILVCNTLLLCLPLYLFALLKLIPNQAWQRFCARVNDCIAQQWVRHNNLGISTLLPTRWQFSGLDGLSKQQWYLLISNHQSWLDIVVLQRMFVDQIPALKFFLKDQLKWVPLLNLAWWGLNFPFMKRYSKAFLEKNPSYRGRDLAATRRSCQQFAKLPVTIMNFVEGTRFTEEKHQAQASPYQGLLKPRAGGMAFVIQAMGERMTHLLDVTIVYPKRPSLWDFLAGRVKKVRAHVEQIAIPAEFCHGDYSNDIDFQTKFRAWLNERWMMKQQILQRLQLETV